MKRLTIIAAAVMMAAACAEKEQALQPEAGTPVVFRVTDDATKAATDYKADSYFMLSPELGSATVYDGGISVTYAYRDGMLVADDRPIVFPKDGSSLPRITVKWPTDAVRLAQNSQGALKDQSSSEAFFSSDYLSATLRNVIPSTVIPIGFDHERCKITFVITGEQAGKKIRSLTIGGYKAYCNRASNDAQLIYDFQYDRGALPAGTTGTVELEGTDGTIDIMILHSPDEMLTGAGDNCTVNLNL